MVDHASSMQVNNINEQLDATITILLILNQLNMFWAIFCPKHVELIQEQ
jgi:hypothetical protein